MATKYGRMVAYLKPVPFIFTTAVLITTKLGRGLTYLERFLLL